MSLACARATDRLRIDWNLAERTRAQRPSWKRAPSPSFGPGSVLTGVSATSRVAWAAGTVIGTPYRTLVLRWNGTGWVRVPSPSPTGDGGSQLHAVAATGKSVWAVGYSGAKMLIEHWPSTAWPRVPSPRLPGANDLAGVTVLSARGAWAVGQGNGKTLIGHWDGAPGDVRPATLANPLPRDRAGNGIAMVSFSHGSCH